MEVVEMSKRTYRKGIEIGSYLITPLGIAAVVVLVVVIALAATMLLKPGSDRPAAATITPAPSIAPTEAPMTPEPTEAPVPTEAPTEAPTAIPALRSATIRSLGEIAIETDLLNSAFDAATSTFDFSPMFSEISAAIGNADYTVADVEGTLGDKSAMSGNGATMRTPSALLTALKDCGVDMLTLANDHILDGSVEELNATMANVTAAGMDYIGAATSQEERNTPVIKEINGIKVGFLAYTESVNGNESNLSAEQRQYAVSMITNSNALEDVNRLRSAGADVIVAYVSWGEMLNRSITQSEQAIAMALAQCGVDVIVGYNPHTIQPIGWLDATLADGTAHRTLVICATGNMLSNQRTQYFDCGVIFQFTIQEQSDGSFAIESPAYLPTYVWRSADTERSTETETVYQYRVMPISQYVGNDNARIPTGMDNQDYQYMAGVLAEIQGTLGTDVAKMISE